MRSNESGTARYERNARLSRDDCRLIHPATKRVSTSRSGIIRNSGLDEGRAHPFFLFG
jgi:hypothetical protein